LRVQLSVPLAVRESAIRLPIGKNRSVSPSSPVVVALDAGGAGQVYDSDRMYIAALLRWRREGWSALWCCRSFAAAQPDLPAASVLASFREQSEPAPRLAHAVPGGGCHYDESRRCKLDWLAVRRALLGRTGFHPTAYHSLRLGLWSGCHGDSNPPSGTEQNRVPGITGRSLAPSRLPFDSRRDADQSRRSQAEPDRPSKDRSPLSPMDGPACAEMGAQKHDVFVPMLHYRRVVNGFH
jgi:hypothetical protein